MTAAKTRRLLAIAAVALIGAALAAFAYLRNGMGELQFQGWIEAYFIFVSPDEAGRVETLAVREGDRVDVGAPLFALDADLQRAAVAENEAAVANARITFERAQELLKRSVGSQKVFDDAQSALRTAEARLNSARTRLERRRVASPAAGTIQEVYFRVGEMVQAGRPILSLLPPDNTRVRFFVPQAVLPRVHIGDRIAVTCDGCAGPLYARVNFLSAQAEFTPPVIYSQEERARLVFRVEAIPERAEELRVGQPVSVALQPAVGVSHARK
jgi:HlyD family secretion protein